MKKKVLCLAAAIVMTMTSTAFAADTLQGTPRGTGDVTQADATDADAPGLSDGTGKGLTAYDAALIQYYYKTGIDLTDGKVISEGNYNGKIINDREVDANDSQLVLDVVRDPKLDTNNKLGIATPSRNFEFSFDKDKQLPATTVKDSIDMFMADNKGAITKTMGRINSTINNTSFSIVDVLGDTPLSEVLGDATLNDVLNDPYLREVLGDVKITTENGVEVSLNEIFADESLKEALGNKTLKEVLGDKSLSDILGDQTVSGVLGDVKITTETGWNVFLTQIQPLLECNGTATTKDVYGYTSGGTGASYENMDKIKELIVKDGGASLTYDDLVNIVKYAEAAVPGNTITDEALAQTAANVQKITETKFKLSFITPNDITGKGTTATTYDGKTGYSATVDDLVAALCSGKLYNYETTTLQQVVDAVGTWVVGHKDSTTGGKEQNIKVELYETANYKLF